VLSILYHHYMDMEGGPGSFQMHKRARCDSVEPPERRRSAGSSPKRHFPPGRFLQSLSPCCVLATSLLTQPAWAQTPEPTPTPTQVALTACESAKKVPSILMSEPQKVEAVKAFVKIVSLPSPSGDEAAVGEELRQRLGSIGATEIKCVHPGNATKRFQSVVMEFPATRENKDRPAVILNAHIDTIGRGRCTPELMNFNETTREFYHQKNGSFGADDKAGVAVILGALKVAKARFWDVGRGHRRVVAIFTAQEETGAQGATHLAKEHPQIFENVEITLSCDGNLDYDTPSFYPKSLFVVVAEEKKRGEVPYRTILDYVKDICDSKGTSFSLTTSGLGMGDFAFFPPQAHSEALHIRSPYQGDHRAERVRLDDLFNHIDLFAYILLRLDGTPVNLTSNAKR
jgi:putative aminopeptidase FrvX